MKKVMPILVPLVGVGARFACLALDVGHLLNYASRLLMHAALIGGAAMVSKNIKNKTKATLTFFGIWLLLILSVALIQFSSGVELITK